MIGTLRDGLYFAVALLLCEQYLWLEVQDWVALSLRPED